MRNAGIFNPNLDKMEDFLPVKDQFDGGACWSVRYHSVMLFLCCNSSSAVMPSGHK